MQVFLLLNDSGRLCFKNAICIFVHRMLANLILSFIWFLASISIWDGVLREQKLRWPFPHLQVSQVKNVLKSTVFNATQCLRKMNFLTRINAWNRNFGFIFNTCSEQIAKSLISKLCISTCKDFWQRCSTNFRTKSAAAVYARKMQEKCHQFLNVCLWNSRSI